MLRMASMGWCHSFDVNHNVSFAVYAFDFMPDTFMSIISVICQLVKLLRIFNHLLSIICSRLNSAQQTHFSFSFIVNHTWGHKDRHRIIIVLNRAIQTVFIIVAVVPFKTRKPNYREDVLFIHWLDNWMIYMNHNEKRWHKSSIHLRRIKKKIRNHNYTMINRLLDLT